MRKVLYITGTRADYGLMRRTLKAIDRHNDLTLTVAATGMHFMKHHGYTIERVREDGFHLVEIDHIFEDDSRAGMAAFVGQTISSLTKVVEEIKPDIVLLLGDRGEMLAGATVGAYAGIPVAHVHGGDVSSTVDDSVRHAITKLSHIHFPATEDSAKRIVRLGEEENRIHVVGAPGLVGISDNILSREDTCKNLGLPNNGEFALLLQHPSEYGADLSTEQIKQTLAALKENEIHTFIIYPNADAGGAAMIDVIEQENSPLFRSHPSVSRQEFLSLMAHCSVMVGNSSAGIIEAASFKTPVINVGTRQTGRQRGKNVVDCDYGTDSVAEALKFVLTDTEFRQSLEFVTNPYGDGKTDQRIAQLLSDIEINPGLIQKRLAY